MFTVQFNSSWDCLNTLIIADCLPASTRICCVVGIVTSRAKYEGGLKPWSQFGNAMIQRKACVK